MKIASLVGVMLLAATVASAEDVGTVAAARGSAEVGRGGVFTPATVGMAVQLGDQLRTGDGQMRVVFRDDSVIDLAERSALVIDKQVFNPDAGRFNSLVKLLGGKAKALVSEYYGTPGASYEIETPTAVAGVRGTSFVVAYNPDLDTTDVVGIRGRIEVRSLSARATESVYVTAQEATSVKRGEAPTDPERLDDQRFDDEVEGLELLSLGNMNSVAGAGAGVQAGAEVPAPDRAPSSAGGLAGQVGRDELKNAGDVVGQPLGVGETRGRLGVPF